MLALQTSLTLDASLMNRKRWRQITSGLALISIDPYLFNSECNFFFPFFSSSVLWESENHEVFFKIQPEWIVHNDEFIEK